MASPKEGDIGTPIEVEAVDENGSAVNLSTETALSIKIVDQTGLATTTSNPTVALTGDGTDGKFRYSTTTAGELVAGCYQIEGAYTLSGGASKKTSTGTFIVDPAL